MNLEHLKIHCANCFSVVRINSRIAFLHYITVKLDQCHMNHILKILENQKFKYFFIITVGGDKFLSNCQCCNFQIVREA